MHNLFGLFLLDEPVIIKIVDVEGQLELVLYVSLGDDTDGPDELVKI